MKDLSTLLVVLLALQALVASGTGAEAVIPVAESDGETILARVDKQQQAFQALQEGETLHLKERKLQLKQTLIIDVSNIVIEGASTRTIIYCPTQTGAFIIRGTNVSFVRLEISGCATGSAVTVSRDDSSFICDKHGQVRCPPKNISGDWRHEVRFVSCLFTNNSHISGGAALVRHARLLVKDSTFRDNHAVDGGAIYAESSTLDIEGSQFRSNSASDDGGAIHAVESEVNIVHSTLRENDADNGGALCASQSNITANSLSLVRNTAAADGGSIHLRISQATLKQAELVDNFGRWGGAFHSKDSQTIVENANFADNRAAVQGGAFYVSKSVLTVTSSTLVNNTGVHGGAFRVGGFSHATLENLTIANNAAEFDGGAIFLTNSEARVKTSEFLTNTGRHGGAFHVETLSRATVEDVLFVGNSAASNGGALYVTKSETTVMESEFRNNSASWGGAFLLETDSHAGVESVLFTCNSAESDGGAFYLTKSAASVKDVSFVKNVAGKGGALYMQQTNATLNGCTVLENVVGSDGGAFYLWDFSGAIKDAEFRGNKAIRGGALYLQTSNVAVSEAMFIGNSAESLGGALNAQMSDVNITNMEFSGNSAKHGGAVWLQQSSASTDQVLFADNSASSSGGAFYLWLSTGTIQSAEFFNNSASRGAALCVKESNLVVENASVAGNSAETEGGAYVLELSNATLNDVKLISNSANRGGAVYTQGSKVVLSESRFIHNEAEFGGAVGFDVGTALDIHHSVFEANFGKRGGAVYSARGMSVVMLNSVNLSYNAADSGGAMHLERGTTLMSRWDDKHTNLFRDNTATENGGALYCDGCELNIQSSAEFVGNIAARSGGGIYLKDSQNATMACLRSRHNMASFGGALAAVDCGYLDIGDSPECASSFASNFATDGGALYIQAGSDIDYIYKIKNSTFESNRAGEKETTLSENDVLAARERIGGLGQTSSNQAHVPPKCSGDLCGRGGAMFVDLFHPRPLKRSRSSSTAVARGRVGLQVTNSMNPCSDVRGRPGFASNAQGSDKSECSLLQFDRIHLKQNFAFSAGGGVFMTGAQDPSLLCEKTFAPANKGSADMNSSGCFVLDGNTIGDEGYGGDFATDAASLHWESVEGSLEGLRSGDLLSAVPISGPNSQRDSQPGLFVDVWDALNQTITVGPDSNLLVVLTSRWILGATRYRANKGIVHIDATTILGVNISDEILLTSDDARSGVSTELKFRTNPCEKGEIEGAFNHTCQRCAKHLYTLSSRDPCRQCEEHALCDNTTGLVPARGYWHSTPFSPLMRRCPVKSACSADNRTQQLFTYYEDLNVIREKMRQFGTSATDFSVSNFEEEYPQCAEGYKGVVCGECAPGHGHASSGECVQCGRTLAVSRLLTSLDAFVLFAVVSLRLLLEIDGVQKDVAFELIQQKKRNREVISRASETHSGASSSSTDQGVLRHRNGAVMKSTSEKTSSASGADKRIGEVVEQGLQSQAELETTTGSAPPLNRCDHNIEEPRDASHNEEVSEDAMEASGMLSETYNILFNYVQLNSVAILLDIDWMLPVKKLLSLQTVMGRLLKIEKYPLDCCFADRDNDVGIPNSICVLLFRLAFPLLTCIVYAFFIQMWLWIRGEQRRSRYEIDLIPPMTLVFCIVYFSYCIDLVSDLLRVLNCVHLQSVESDHIYAHYELLRGGHVWAEDTSVKCWEGGHFWLVVFAAIGLIFSLVIIAFAVIVLRRGKKQGRLQDPKFRLNYGFLFLKYRTDGVALHWESVITVRRMLLAAVGVYSRTRETTNAEIGFMAIVIFTSIALREIVKPFVHQDSKATFPSYAGGLFRCFSGQKLATRWVEFNKGITLNSLEAASLFMSLSLFLTAMSINDDDAGTVQEYALLFACFLLNVLFSGFMLYRIWCGFHHYLDISARDGSVKFRGKDYPEEDNNTWLFVKVWVLYLRPKTEPRTQTEPLLLTLA